MKKMVVAALVTGMVLGCTQSGMAEEAITFADLQDYAFVFSSGAGAWSTELYIGANGEFSGSFHDSDMGTTGEGYPDGTVYLCNFDGMFQKLEYVNDYTYETKIKEIKYLDTPDTEEIIDGVRYVYSFPYGLEDADRIKIYLPGAPIDELPVEFVNWVKYTALYGQEDVETLPFYGLYNEAQEEGFSSYLLEQYSVEQFDVSDYDWDEDFLTGIDRELWEMEKKAKELNDIVSTGAVSQSELNNAAYDLYNHWDIELNDMWKRLKNMLDKPQMDALTKEEITWINEKEKAAQKAGMEFEGGSMQPMLEYLTAAEWTRLRVYELAEYFR